MDSDNMMNAVDTSVCNGATDAPFFMPRFMKRVIEAYLEYKIEQEVSWENISYDND